METIDTATAAKEFEATLNDKRMLRHLLLDDYMAFVRYFFKERDALKFMISPHHRVIVDTLMKVITGEITRLIINVPPGYTKCISRNTPVLMSSGLQKPVQDIRVGDEVMSHIDGRLVPQRIIGTENFVKPCVNIITGFGRELAVSHDHPVLTHHGWVKAEDLTTDDNIIGLDDDKSSFIGHPVTSVTPVGNKRVYHLSVDAEDYDHKNFIANNLVVHNTELAVIFFVAYGIAKNPQAKYIHATYSDELALENSSKAKDIIESEEFQELFSISIRKDSSAKKKWYTHEGGGILAAAAGGAITGFRAGRFEEGFQGAFIFDDPIKPDDAFSETMRNKINTRFMNTFKSRLAVESRTPMIIIMQRIHDEDPCGFLLRGGTGEMWHHLLLPSPVPPGPVSEWYPKEYTHGIPIEYDLEEGALWPFKHTDEQLERMDQADPYTTASQYHQSPSPKGGSIFRDEWWQLWTILPPDLCYIRIYGDTAQQTDTHNDYTVLQAWAFSPSKGIFLLDQFRDKLEAPQLETAIMDFWNKTVATGQKLGIPVTHLKLENKSSGSSLIQNISQKTHIPVFPIEREKDKVARSFNFVPHISSGHVWIPLEASWVFDYKDEFRKFTPQMSHSHDDQIDPTLDAIEDNLSGLMVSFEGVETLDMDEVEYAAVEYAH